MPQGTEKEELHVTGSPIGSGMTKKETPGTPKADSESGRSMVETLGVLAIMGVLAIGGVMAYRYAVTKYQANETFNELRRRVIVHSQQSIVGAPLSQVELGDETQLGYPIDVMRVDGSFFELILQDIDKRLCQEMVRTGWTLPTQTRVNGIVIGTNPVVCGEDNTIIFRFQTEMGGCKADEDCPCGTCANGVCQTTCGSGESCVKDFNDGQYVCCPSEKLVGNSCCAYPGENGTCCDENSENCCPPDKPLIDQNGKCWACDEEQAIPITWWTEPKKEICDRCTNRVYMRGSWRSHLCALKCPDEMPLMDSRGGCHACDESTEMINVHGIVDSCYKCPGIRFLGEGDTNWANGCWRCDTDTQSIRFGVTVSKDKQKEGCDACQNRITSIGGRGYCAKPCVSGDMDNFGQCHDCSDPDGYEVYGLPQEYTCTCSNRFVIKGSANATPYCARYCDDKKQFLDSTGKCHTCDDPTESIVVFGIPDQCQICAGTRYLDRNYYCKSCPEDISSLTPAQQEQCRDTQTPSS